MQRRVLLLIFAGLFIFLALEWARGCQAETSVSLERLPEHRHDFQVDINSAGWAELLQLPGIGPKLAEEILKNRQEQGPFRSLSDLDRVMGIGPQKLAELRPYLRWQTGNENTEYPLSGEGSTPTPKAR